MFLYNELKNFSFLSVHPLPSLFEKRKHQLVKFYREHHRLPTYNELVRLFDMKSKGSVHTYIKKFFDSGLIRKSDHGKLIPTDKLYGLRVLGTVAAGFPSPAEEELVDTMSLDDWLIRNPEASYLLTISGDSMIDAGIMQGDLVIVDRSRTPKTGDIVVAEVDREWTIKYFIKRNDRMWLRAANRNYPDIHPKEELKIGGVVTSVIRKYVA